MLEETVEAWVERFQGTGIPIDLLKNQWLAFQPRPATQEVKDEFGEQLDRLVTWEEWEGRINRLP